MLDVENRVRLVETTDLYDIYICLLYCWGSFQPIKTLESNFELYQQETHWNSLPKTFQDAVFIVRKLRLRYLWIDGLCIIQDRLSDWKAQAARMADIYTKAFFTIAVVGPNSARDGCFPYISTGHRAFPLARALLRGRVLPSFSDKITIILELPLLYRARGFQERNLSPRVLYFGKTEIYWECDTTAYCGCRPGVRRDPARSMRVKAEPWMQWQLIINNHSELS